MLVDEFVFSPDSGTAKSIRSRNKWVAGATALVLALATAGAFVLRSGGSAEAVTLSYAFDLQGQRTYDVSMSIDVVPHGIEEAKPFKGTISGTLVLDVVSKAEDGSAIIALRFSGVTAEPNPTGMPSDWGEMRMRVAPDGRIVNVEGTGGLFGAAGSVMSSQLATQGGAPTDTTGSQYLFPRFPTGAVKPGDSWNETSTVKLPFGKDEITLNTVGKHNGYEGTPYGEAAKVHHSVASPLDLSFTFADLAAAMGDAGASMPPQLRSAAMTLEGDTSMKADSLVIPKTGDLVKLEGSVDMSMNIALSGIPLPPGQSNEMSFDAKIALALDRIDAAA